MKTPSAPETVSAHIRRGVVLIGSGAVINIAFLFAETIVAARLLPTGQYGIFVLLIAVVNFLVVAVDFGCKTAITKLLASSDRTQQAQLAGSALVFRLGVVAALALGIWLFQSWIRALDEKPGLLIYLNYIPIMLAAASLDELCTSILQGMHAYIDIAVAASMRSVLRLGLSVVLLYEFQLGVLALILSWCISFAVSAAYQYLVLPLPKRFTLDRPLVRELLRFGVPLHATRFLWVVFRRVDVVLLGILATPVSVAYYEVAAKIPDALQRLAESYFAVYYPTMSGLLSDGKRAEARAFLNQSLRLFSFVGALTALVAVVWSHEIVTLVFSETYASSSATFAVLMIVFHMLLLVNLFGYTLTSAGFPGRSLTKNVARTVLNVVGDLLLIPLFGFIGPAFATLIAVYAANPLGIWLLRRSQIAIEMTPYVTQTLLLLVCAALWWWALPALWLAKIGIVLVFVLLNLLLSTVSVRDLRLIVPQRQPRPVPLPQERLS